MGSSERRQWMEYRADQATGEFDIACLPLLPPDVQVAIKSLVAHAFERGYDWGFHEGRATLATGREPSYSVPKPALEIAIEPRDVA
jgi:hypothetical protein